MITNNKSNSAHVKLREAVVQRDLTWTKSQNEVNAEPGLSLGFLTSPSMFFLFKRTMEPTAGLEVFTGEMLPP